MQEITQDCERMILYHANKFRRYYDMDDLFQVGSIGLEEAKKKYDPSYGTKLSTFAFPYIKGAIYRYIKNDRLIKCGKNYEKVISIVEKAREFLRQKLMREPTLEELSVFTELETSEIEEAMMSQELVRSLDYIMNEDDDGKSMQLYDAVPYIEKGYQEDILDLKVALDHLTEEERQLIDRKSTRLNSSHE